MTFDLHPYTVPLPSLQIAHCERTCERRHLVSQHREVGHVPQLCRDDADLWLQLAGNIPRDLYWVCGDLLGVDPQWRRVVGGIWSKKDFKKMICDTPVFSWSCIIFIFPESLACLKLHLPLHPHTYILSARLIIVIQSADVWEDVSISRWLLQT